MPTTEIRPARRDEVAVILELIVELAEYERSRDSVQATEALLDEALFGDQPHAFAHLAVGRDDDGRDVIAGLALWYLTYSTWEGRHGIWLEDLYVRPAWRGRGLGRGLLRELAAICGARGYGRLEWSVLDWNEPARSFYRSVGANELDDWIMDRMSGVALRRLAAG